MPADSRDMVRTRLDWPTGEFRVHDPDPDDIHSAIYLVCPNGLMVNTSCDPHPTRDAERTRWMADALNAALSASPARGEGQRHLSDPVSPLTARLHKDTAELVNAFAIALAHKLRRAEEKYGYSNGWLTDDWEAKCKADLLEHVHKGDPLDVAAYAAFCWARSWSTTPVAPSPVEVTIFCPACSVPHVDEGEWATTRHHKTHQCQSCGHEWRPFPFATVGVAHPPSASDGRVRVAVEALRKIKNGRERAVEDGSTVVVDLPADEVEQLVDRALASLEGE